MSVEFRLETTGAQAIERALGGLVQKFSGLEDFMAAVGGWLADSTRPRFEAGTAPDGSKWEPSQRVLKDGGRTLALTRRLKDSITSEATGSSVAVGTVVQYARIHQFGFDGSVQVKAHNRKISQAFGRKLATPVSFNVNAFERLLNMPARPYLGISADDEAQILGDIEDYARDAAGGAL